MQNYEYTKRHEKALSRNEKKREGKKKNKVTAEQMKQVTR